MVGFWFLEVSSLLFVYMLFSFFLSGHMFPLDMLAGVPWRHVTGATWSDAAAAVPGVLSRGGVSGQDPGHGARGRARGSKLAWVVFFIVVCRVAFQSAALQALQRDYGG